MRLGRHIPVWLAAVIVTLVAALLPSDARAHGNHAHGNPVPAAQMAGATDDAVDPSREMRSSEDRIATRSGDARAASLSIAGKAAFSCACAACLAGAACGHAPSSCCATGLAPVQSGAIDGPDAHDRNRPRDGPRLTGIVPEAQAEPPRPFA